MSENETFKKHYVAVIGGSIAGSEAANLLAESGFKVVVFEMNKLPYGKIEDGLPNWHVNLRDRQIKEIDRKLAHPNITFVPNTKIGKDIQFLDLLNNWGFSAIIIANGAWCDRRLTIPAIEQFLDKELVYQNPFIYWFNHKHEHDYNGHNYFLRDNTVVIGGGLASLDVVKIVMIELVKKQLYLDKGIDVDLFTLEKEGIPKVLAAHGITFEELNIGKAKLVYRRTAKYMPLKSPKDHTKESIEAAQKVSEKLLNKYLEKYAFEFIPLAIPVGFKEENGKLVAVVFQNVSLESGRIIPVENSFFELETAMLIASIGSVPEQISGLNYEWGTLKMKEPEGYRVAGFNNVFAVGNAVTGRGNIQESKKHGKQMTEKIIDEHLTNDALENWLTNFNSQIINDVDDQVLTISKQISKQQIQPIASIESMLQKVAEIHKNNNYTTYQNWVEKNIPIRLEQL
ncbi:NADPH-dependent glutamate synthase beta chain [Lutibacter agarilyticus]|uniref:NADPH-dependent glutamate synthase beta chain n=1 Tax=Lutibacter agarilyticus TaxID=1109740 RepID=A0A238V8M1_9FLAO|nr:FAD-dependent oxidoreductase [Lutibacter agarilyticus]SNR30551.1 NADPH-dependent glutamate synthase beta chain [Lutibacter agarilyticus]